MCLHLLTGLVKVTLWIVNGASLPCAPSEPNDATSIRGKVTPATKVHAIVLHATSHRRNRQLRRRIRRVPCSLQYAGLCEYRLHRVSGTYFSTGQSLELAVLHIRSLSRYGTLFFDDEGCRSTHSMRTQTGRTVTISRRKIVSITRSTT